MGESNRLDKLTEREREALRGWLQHKTAKEIALDLGISHYAVEKRLKTSRLKLGVSSSLEAARFLASQEGYGLTGAQAPDLSADRPAVQPWLTRPRIMGAMAMSILAAILLGVALQSGGSADGSAAGNVSPGNDDIPKIVLAKGTPAQVEAFVSSKFAEFDKDRSGYIEEREGPRSIQLCCANDPGDTLTGTAAWRHFLAENADDGDSRVSYGEFRQARYDRFLRNGIPVERQKLVVTGERPSPYGEQQPGDGKMRRFLADMEFVKASPERVRAYVRQMFDNMDKDASGFIELAEAPAMLGMPKGKMAADGTVTYDRNDPLTQLTGDEARTEYIKNVDQDGDERVSFEEYAKPVTPQYLQRGIPLIPADWTTAKVGARKEE